MHGTFVDHHTWAIEDRPRIAQALRLIDRDRRRGVVIVHLHGLRDPAGKGATQAGNDRESRPKCVAGAGMCVVRQRIQEQIRSTMPCKVIAERQAWSKYEPRSFDAACFRFTA